MITCVVGLFAAQTIIDGRSNNVSVINILEDIQAVAFPLMFPSMEGLFLMARDEGDSEHQEFSLTVALSGKVIFTSPVFCEFQGKLRARLIVQLQGLPIPGPGDLTFDLLKDSVKVGGWRCEVKAIESPKGPILTSTPEFG